MMQIRCWTRLKSSGQKPLSHLKATESSNGNMTSNGTRTATWWSGLWPDQAIPAHRARYEKLASHYSAFIALVASFIWLV